MLAIPLILAAASAAAVAGYLYWALTRPLPAGVELFPVRPGESLTSVARRLVDEGVLREPWSLIAWAHLEQKSRRIRAGEYRLQPGLTVPQLLDRLVSGKVIEYPVALIEGHTFREMLATLAAQPRLEHTLTGLDPAAIMARLGHPGLHWEGRFFPDTYHYPAGTRDLSILQRAFRRMEEVLAQEWEARAPGLPLDDPYEALILASIVEKETAMPSERDEIAGVFVNRLERGMRLQTDPTVIYGLGEQFDGNLTREHLRTDTPHNTYTRSGLPPTPIAMPGRDAIHAALHPAQTQALYFVSRGDGSHVFSRTLEQHNRAVTRHQLGGRAQHAHTGTEDAPEGEEEASGG